MKKNEILVGRYYSDGKEGLRLVQAEGSQYKLYPGVADDDGLQIRILSAKARGEIGSITCCTRTSMAAWAKFEVAAEDVENHINALLARKLVHKLTDVQLQFLKSFDKDLTTGSLVECHRDEFRAAKWFSGKGLIIDLPDKVGPNENHFELRFSALGLAVLTAVPT